MKLSANIVDILNRVVFPGTIAIEHGVITHISRDSGPYKTFIMPGFVDSHTHIESSMMVPAEFARLAVRHGTVAAVADPHEIANVLGVDGVLYMTDDGKRVPFTFCFGTPSSVPATSFETAGAVIGPHEMESLFRRAETGLLSEMMNVPGVLAGDPDVMEKLAVAKRFRKPVDGHAPGLRGAMLAKYIEAGISTDHEVSDYDEAKEKISLGMKIQIREGSAAKNFETLMPLIPRYGESCMFCSDDIHPEDLVDGHINRLVKRACDAGIDIMDALRCACLNPVVHYGLNTGLLRVDDSADFIEVDDLESLNILRTYIRGNLVAESGLALVPHSPSPRANNFRAEPKRAGDFVVRDMGRMVNIIEAVNNQIITGRTKALPRPVNGTLVSDTGQDILKLAVVNRYRNSPPAVAFVRNFGLKSGAIASSIAHDSHNIIVVGVTDEEICGAVNAVIEHRGGLSVVYGGGTEVLPLPVAGLMTDGDGFRTAQEYARLNVLAKRLGSRLDAPFMTLSFMALLVIPDLKLSDKGLFDGIKFCLTDLFC